jgi:hypothetical protein
MKIGAVILALMMLVPTSGFAVDFHICQGKVKSFTIFGKAKGCSKMADGVKCTESPKKNMHQDGINKKPCCENETIFVKFNANDRGDNERITSPVNQISFDVAVTVLYELEFISENKLPLEYNSNPPPLMEDRTVWFESFLI